MTVLTFPSVCGKSDKAPLIGDEVVHRPGQTQPPPPPPYRPSSLETGDGAKIRARSVEKQVRALCKVTKIAFVLMAFALLFYFSMGALTKFYSRDARHARPHPLDSVEYEDMSDEPCKSYTSYAAAENDMLSLPSSSLPSSSPPPPPPPPSSKNLIISLVINPVEGTVSKVPPIVINKSARFVHDFSVNITGIIDLENQRCYVMPLIRSSVEPPESLYDMLIKMSSGYYSSDINKILRNFRMVKPALDDLSDYGMYISKDCADYPTFKLEKVIATESP